MAKTKSKQEEQVDAVAAEIERDLTTVAGDAVVVEADASQPEPPRHRYEAELYASPEDALQDAKAALHATYTALKDLFAFIEERQLVARNDRQRTVVENARRILECVCDPGAQLHKEPPAN